MITLQYSKRIIHLTGPEKGLATGAHTRNKLKREFMKLLAAQPNYGNPVKMSVNDSTLIAMVRKYSEQFVFQPLDEIKYWMGHSSPDVTMRIYAKVLPEAEKWHKNTIGKALFR